MKTFSFSRQYSWMHSSETRSVMWLLYVSRTTCKPRQADTFVRLNRKPNVLCLQRSVGQYEIVSASRRLLTEHQHQRTSVRCSETFGEYTKPDHCPMLSARLLFWASSSLDMCPLMRFARLLPFLARSCRLLFASWARWLPKPFFSWPLAFHRMKFQRNVFGSLDVVHREDGHVCLGKWCTPGVRHLETAPFWCSSLHHGETKPHGGQRKIVGCGRFLTH